MSVQKSEKEEGCEGGGGEWRVREGEREMGRLKETKKGEKRGEERQIEAEGW